MVVIIEAWDAWTHLSVNRVLFHEWHLPQSPWLFWFWIMHSVQSLWLVIIWPAMCYLPHLPSLGWTICVEMLYAYWRMVSLVMSFIWFVASCIGFVAWSLKWDVLCWSVILYGIHRLVELR